MTSTVDHVTVTLLTYPNPRPACLPVQLLLAFCAGLTLAWSTEALEDWMMTPGDPAPAILLDPHPHLDEHGRWARPAPAEPAARAAPNAWVSNLPSNLLQHSPSLQRHVQAVNGALLP